jgi:peptide/nickel transport system substrate-binding protein
VASALIVALVAALATSGSGAASGQAGGTLRIAESLVQPTLDPATDPQYQSDEIAAVYDTLVAVLPGGKIIPSLATSWKSQGLSITFQLRKGVKFQDGTPFNAQAVKSNLDRIEKPSTKATNAKGILGPYARSTVLGPYTLKVTWAKPYVNALINFADADLAISSPKAAASGNLATHPVGTGPYMFSSYRPGQQLVLVRNPNYSTIRPDLKNKGPAKFSKLVFQYVTNESTRENLLQTGGTDVTRLDGVYAARALKNSRIQHRQFASINEYYAAINYQKITDLAVRDAIFKAIDRKALIAATAAGFAVINNNALPTTIPGYSSAVQLPAFSVAAARQALTDAGYKPNSSGVMEKNGEELSFQILSSNQDPYPALDQLIQDQLSQVGIKTTILTQTSAAVEITRRQGGQGIMVGQYGVLDPTGAMDILWGCDNVPSANHVGFNFSFWCNKSFDAVITAASADNNATTRNAKLVKAQQILMNDRVSLTLYQSQSLLFSGSNIGGASLQLDGIIRINDLVPKT